MITSTFIAPSENPSQTVWQLDIEDVCLMMEAMGHSRTELTDNRLHVIKKGLDFGLDNWSHVLRIAIQDAFEETA